jgi:hypothetical protein
MDETTLHRFTQRIPPALRDHLIEETETPQTYHQPVLRANGSVIDLVTADDLMETLTPRCYDADWATSPATSDRWLAPRLHYALRLTRAQAGDRNLWAWLAMRYSAYVNWRWANPEEVISEDRWSGPVNKQALMRLWWGAELFRNGADYSTVERAFLNQDFPNSYLNRTLVRCRSLALGLVDVIAPTEGDATRRSNEINDLARVLNLAMAGSPPELETDFQQDDLDAYQGWLEHVPAVPASWDETPRGPAALDTTKVSLSGGRSIAERGWTYAIQAKQIR